MGRFIFFALSLFMMACSSPATRAPRPIPTLAQLARQGEMPCSLLQWEDGDTAFVRCAGKKETVRLIGMDTAESAFDENSRRRGLRQAGLWGMSLQQVFACGKAASRRVEQLCPAGSAVTVTGNKRGHYGRLLAYISCLGVNINERMVAEGLAGRYPYPAPPAKPAACPLP